MWWHTLGSTFVAPSVGFLLLPSCDICGCCASQIHIHMWWHTPGSTFMSPTVGFSMLPVCDCRCCCALRKSTFTCGGTRWSLGPTLVGSECRCVSLALLVVPESIGGNQKLLSPTSLSMYCRQGGGMTSKRANGHAYTLHTIL